jgi:diguanylate cyclase (GGDEF)-like protein
MEPYGQDEPDPPFEDDRRADGQQGVHAWKRDRDKSRAEHSRAASMRDQARQLRDQTSGARLAAAEQRDAAARSRDRAAARRDAAAQMRDELAVSRDPAAITARELAAADRREAELDRQRAGEDRAQAHIDREALQSALEEAHLDDLTGTFRRGMGVLALQAEIDRARRSGTPLVLGFVDVDDLKVHNDKQGHAYGDALLLDVVTSIRSNLRSYDPVVRFGGDEFICGLAGATLDEARARFDEIGRALFEVRPGATITTGFAELRAGDTLESLVERGDVALYEAKARR